MGSRFESKVALITGATSGVGAAVARRIAAEGGAVVLGARGKEAGDRVAEEIRAAGGRALFVPTDVTVEADVARLTEAALNEFGRLDAAFNNAGAVNAFGPVEDIDEAGWRASGIESHRRVLRSAAPGSGPDRIRWRRDPQQCLQPRCGRHGFGRTLCCSQARGRRTDSRVALETADQNIRVNALASGAVDTPAFRLHGRHTRRRGRYRRNAPHRPHRSARGDRRLLRLPPQRRGQLHHRRRPGRRRRFHHPLNRTALVTPRSGHRCAWLEPRRTGKCHPR